jgi:hypothetical protein
MHASRQYVIVVQRAARLFLAKRRARAHRRIALSVMLWIARMRLRWKRAAAAERCVVAVCACVRVAACSHFPLALDSHLTVSPPLSFSQRSLRLPTARSSFSHLLARTSIPPRSRSYHASTWSPLPRTLFVLHSLVGIAFG